MNGVTSHNTKKIFTDLSLDLYKKCSKFPALMSSLSLHFYSKYSMAIPTGFDQPACSICCKELCNRAYVNKHIKNVHGRSLPTRTVGRKKFHNNDYRHVRDKNVVVDQVHLACSCCNFTCPKVQDGYQTLNTHVREKHDPMFPRPFGEEESQGSSGHGNVADNDSLAQWYLNSMYHDDKWDDEFDADFSQAYLLWSGSDSDEDFDSTGEYDSDEAFSFYDNTENWSYRRKSGSSEGSDAGEDLEAWSESGPENKCDGKTDLTLNGDFIDEESIEDIIVKMGKLYDLFK